MLDSISDSICLEKLRCINKIAEVLRITVCCLHVFGNFSISSVISLMFLHHIRKWIQFFRIICYCFKRFYRREWLKTKLRCISEEIFTIFWKWLIAMPYFPVMGISTVLSSRFIKASTWWRRRRPEKGLVVCLFQCLWQDIFELFNIISTLILALGLIIAPVCPCRFDFIVAAP